MEEIEKKKYTVKDGRIYTIYRYSKPTKIDKVLNELFQSKDCRLSRTHISLYVFNKNFCSMELDFYRDGMLKEQLITVEYEQESNGNFTEYWKLA